MEYTEYIIKFTCSSFNQKWNFDKHYLELYYFRALKSGRTLTAVTRQHIIHFLKQNCKLYLKGY